ncbi:metallophosphoesterase [Variovorax sp. E3]|uniref:metallophosphoesterase family protein n=1 Tax=Variovorax sp. E3 TaxID=1914993 RepID=UPI0022B662D3|nr:metallophosphoesterase [Variovorax sp. E3]
MSKVEGERPRILFVGDPHGAFDIAIDAVRQHAPEAIVLLGDVQPRTPLQLELAPILDRTDVWFIHGNHDTDSDQDFDNLFLSELAHRNLHGRVETIAGYRVAGLGGVFRQKIWDPATPPDLAPFRSRQDLLRHAQRGRAAAQDGWRGGYARKHHSSIFPDEIDSLSLQSADILVTHEAPAAHPRGFQVLDDLAIALGARLLVHGHHHKTVDYIRDGLMDASAPFAAYGVDMGSFLTWPRIADKEQETR